jgi:hypothetical protein
MIACHGEQFLGAFPNCEERLSASPRLSAWNDSTHAEQIFMKFYI